MTRFDPATPNTARVYSRLLGGKDHFAPDRAEADVLLGIYPPLAEMVQENRAFLAEAVTWAAGQGIGQFLDLGAGLPATPAVHQIAQEVRPSARVAYVDNDPVVLAHARALLAAPGVAAVTADLRDPAAVLADPDLRAVIDPAEPACVILGAVLHFLDAGTARDVTAGYARLVAPGSCLVISCASFDDETLAKRLAADYTAGPFVNHTREDVVSFFAGLDLVGPGVTEAQTWRAWRPEPVLRRREGHVLSRRGTSADPRPAKGASPVKPETARGCAKRRRACAPLVPRSGVQPDGRPRRPGDGQRAGPRSPQPARPPAVWERSRTAVPGGRRGNGAWPSTPRRGPAQQGNR